MNDRFPSLGVGLGYRRAFRAPLFLDRRAVDFLEITADHFFAPTPEVARELDLLAAHFRLIPHSLDLSLGSAEGLDRAYLDELAALVDRLDPPWWSEHVAFTRAGGVEIGHLCPVPFSRESLDVLCANIDEARRAIGRPLILENITRPVEMPSTEMTEAEFLAELTELSGCGLLLDVTNLFTNATNHGLDPRALLDELPLDRVVQIHFAGGHWHDGVLIDSHSRPTAPEVWDLLEAVLEQVAIPAMTLERDEDLPLFDEIAAELGRARAIGRRHGRWA
jgi:uncharacterized protein (UPF0276 family)